MADENDDDEVRLPGLPPNTKNYMTPACYRRLLDEREHLVNVERPEVVNVVSWAASNGDRSENGDYLYGKRRLREIDRRIRFLNKRIESAEVVDPDSRPLRTRFSSGRQCSTAIRRARSTRSESSVSMRPMPITVT